MTNNETIVSSGLMKVRPLFFASMLWRAAGFASGVSREIRAVSRQDYPHVAPGSANWRGQHGQVSSLPGQQLKECEADNE